MKEVVKLFGLCIFGSNLGLVYSICVFRGWILVQRMSEGGGDVMVEVAG